MAEGWSEAEIFANYPGITHDEIIACFAYVSASAASRQSW